MKYYRSLGLDLEVTVTKLLTYFVISSQTSLSSSSFKVIVCKYEATKSL
jgi:hypothetical protein